jgi:hypothetical protein
MDERKKNYGQGHSSYNMEERRRKAQNARSGRTGSQHPEFGVGLNWGITPYHDPTGGVDKKDKELADELARRAEEDAHNNSGCD